MTDKDTSTLQATMDKVTGTVQNAIGSLTGSSKDQVLGQKKQHDADVKHDVSQAGASVGGYSVSASGVTKNDPNRSDGSYNQTVGSGKEFIGGIIGSEKMKQEGQAQNQAGKEQEAAGQLSDLGKGISDRVGGTVGGAVAGLTGDRVEQAKYQDQHDAGKTRQRGVEADLEKKAPH